MLLGESGKITLLWVDPKRVGITAISPFEV
jgi:hypothetical protein